MGINNVGVNIKKEIQRIKRGSCPGNKLSIPSLNKTTSATLIFFFF